MLSFWRFRIGKSTTAVAMFAMAVRTSKKAPSRTDVSAPVPRT
jgi:hypothetical protein